MATNTLGEFSDGEDDFVFEIDESLWNNSKDDEDEVLNQTTTNTLGSLAMVKMILCLKLMKTHGPTARMMMMI